ncbi:MAG: hypothetical protein M3R51_08305 [Candidatus Eremiobacteraeota bacterium]|nr:hypothetical protein [Candidatus Eremiobacteraeota bacterium]
MNSNSSGKTGMLGYSRGNSKDDSTGVQTADSAMNGSAVDNDETSGVVEKQ